MSSTKVIVTMDAHTLTVEYADGAILKEAVTDGSSLEELLVRADARHEMYNYLGGV